MAKEKEMTLGELIESEKFQSLLAEQVKKAFKQYDEAKAKITRQKREIKRNPMMRLRELGAEDPKKMTELYIAIIDGVSEHPSTIREWVKAICEPVLNKCLLDLMREQNEKEAENGEAGQS